jgi:hypothetical protein
VRTHHSTRRETSSSRGASPASLALATQATHLGDTSAGIDNWSRSVDYCVTISILAENLAGFGSGM